MFDRTRLRNGQPSRSPDPALTISLIKKESFKADLESREDVCLPNFKVVLQKRGLRALPPFLQI